MTSQPSDTPASAPAGPGRAPGGQAPVDDPAGPGERTARQLTDPLRQPAAFALLVANGLILLFAVMDMLVVLDDWPANFLTRAGSSFVDFVGIVSIGFPLLAVLLATHVKPRVPGARLVTVLALVEYGVSALFGALCLLVDFLHGVTDSQTNLGIGPARRAFEDFLVRSGQFTVLAIAAFAVFLLFQGLYPRTGAVAVAANPPYGGGYPPGFGQPGYGPPGYGPPGYQPGSGQPGYQPGSGQPGYPSAYRQPTHPSGFQPTHPSGFQPYGQQATGYGGPQSVWTAAQPPGGPGTRSESGPVAGDDAQPTQPIQRPADDDAQPTQPIQRPAGPEGPTQQWMRP